MDRQYYIDLFSKPTYIGDSVYISFDGYHFILETNNDYPYQPSNRIALEYEVIEKLLEHRKYTYETFEKLREFEKEQKEKDNA